MRDIKEGDRVEFVFVGSCGETIMLVKGIVENAAANVGDLWYIREDDGRLQAINPACHTLERIVKIPEEVK